MREARGTSHAGSSMKHTKRRKHGVSGELDQEAYLRIREMLFYDEIVPGQKIKYHDLAKRIGVSITPVIHALKWLEFKGIVRRETNRGYFVNEISFLEIKEIYDTRHLLEVSLVPEIMSHWDEQSLERLDTSFQEYKRAVDESDYAGRLMTDMRFHLTLASISQCRIRLKMLQELFDLLLLKYNRDLVFLSIMETSQKEHLRILREAKNGNQEALRTAVSDHIRNVQSHITKRFERMFTKKRESIPDLHSFR